MDSRSGRGLVSEQRARRKAPNNEIPVVLPWTAVLASGDELVVALLGAWVYRDGLALVVTIYARRGIGPNLDDALLGDVDEPGDDPSDPEGLDLLLRVGYADGRHTSTRSADPQADPAMIGTHLPDDEPVLRWTGGSCIRGSQDAQFFLSPLPPAGGLTVDCAWPGQGLPETRTVLDTNALADAAGRAEILWPEPHPQQTPPPPPAVPPSGWFARILSDDEPPE